MMKNQQEVWKVIISNVSPKTHFIAKIISSTVFVLIQGALLIGYSILGIVIRIILKWSALV